MDGDEDYSFFSRYAAGGPAVLRPPAPRKTSPNPFDALDDTPAPNRIVDEEETPLQQLIRHWMNERHAPDLLPAQQVLLAGLLDHIHRQTDTVQTLRADPSSSEEDHFRIMLVQTEIERVKFIVRSYVRTRLFKIEKYARFITMNEELQMRMTATEQEHARRHADLTDEHFFSSVLQSLPPPQRALDEEFDLVPAMIAGPDLNRAVIARARSDCPALEYPNGKTGTFSKGNVVLTPYNVVERLVEEGFAELV